MSRCTGCSITCIDISDLDFTGRRQRLWRARLASAGRHGSACVRAVITRVAWARVRVDGSIVGEIGAGICALIGVGKGDTERDGEWLADKIASARIFEDEQGKMNRSLLDLRAFSATGPGAEPRGQLLAISQFTLYGDMRRGHRPSFSAALEPEPAKALFERVCARISTLGIPVETGRFGAHMEVESLNDGPVTLLLDSQKTF